MNSYIFLGTFILYIFTVKMICFLEKKITKDTSEAGNEDEWQAGRCGTLSVQLAIDTEHVPAMWRNGDYQQSWRERNQAVYSRKIELVVLRYAEGHWGQRDCVFFGETTKANDEGSFAYLEYALDK